MQTRSWFINHKRTSSKSLAMGRLFLRAALALVGLWLGCFFGLGSAGVFDLDEGLYATVARQMVESGNWIVPRVGSETFFDKPPLFYWLEALGIKLLGATPLAVRLPSAGATALTAIALWWWCRQRGSERLGWIAAALFLFCPLSFALAREAALDSLLTLWLTLAVIAGIEANRAQGRAKQGAYLWMAVAMGLATMTKGVIGALLPLMALVSWLFVCRDRAEARRVPWLGMALVVALIIAPWHLAMWCATGEEFVRQYIVHNHIQRFTGEDFKHNAPFWSYLPVLLIGMFPWGLFVPLSWWRGWQMRRAQSELPWAMWAIWAAVVVVFFSISRSKLPSYVLPAVPALCLLVASRLDALWTTQGALARAEAVALGFVGFLLGGLLFSLGALGWSWRGQSGALFAGKAVAPKTLAALSALSPTVGGVGAVLLLGCLWMLLRWKKTPLVVAGGAETGALLVFILAGLGLPAWNAFDIAPLHDLARRTLPDLEQGDPLVLYGFKPRRPSVRFLLGHTAQITETGDPLVLRGLLQRSGGLILTPANRALPALPGAVHQQGASPGWTLWKCDPPTR